MNDVQPTHGIKPNVGQVERAISVALGAILVSNGIQKLSIGGLLEVVAGACAVKRGLTGTCQLYTALNLNTAEKSEQHTESIKVQRTISVKAPRSDVYKFWRKFDNLVQIMPNLKSVQENGDGHSHWIAKGPFGQEFSWDARVINEVENELIAWRSLPDSQLSNAGTVRFEEGRDGVTHVRVSMAYTPPGGQLGEALAEFLGQDPHNDLHENLQRFKQLIETKALTSSR